MAPGSDRNDNLPPWLRITTEGQVPQVTEETGPAPAAYAPASSPAAAAPEPGLPAAEQPYAQPYVNQPYADRPETPAPTPATGFFTTVGDADQGGSEQDPTAEAPRGRHHADDPVEERIPEPSVEEQASPAEPEPVAEEQAEPAHAEPAPAEHPTPSAAPAAPAAAPRPGQHSAPGQYDLTPPPALDQSNLVNPVKPAPRKGWRRLVHDATGGRVNPGESEKELEHERLLEKIRRPLRGDYRIAVMSLKGGVGKTTTTVALGGVFASVRGDRVIAIDANPDLGTLAQRVAAPGPATIRDLLAAEDTSRYTNVRQFTTQAKSRLEVIGSERDPAVSEAFSEDDYRYAIDILQHHYNVMLTDCGTGLMHSAMSGVLDLANTLVLVTSPALDGAQSASATLDWLNLHGYEQLAANAVVVISAAHPGQATIDMDQLVGHFRSRARAVHLVPFDRHLSEGATVDLELLSKKTRASYLELAAIIAEDFDSWHRHATQ